MIAKKTEFLNLGESNIFWLNFKKSFILLIFNKLKLVINYI